MAVIEGNATTWNDCPIVRCPNCDLEFQYDDYYDVEAGREIECIHCKTELEIMSVDTTIQWRVGIKDTTPRRGNGL